jgi:hypothetical protein
VGGHESPKAAFSSFRPAFSGATAEAAIGNGQSYMIAEE